MKLETQISDYVRTKELFNKYKKLETEQRVGLLEKLFPAAGVGTLTEYKAGMKIKGTFRLNYKVDLEALETFEADFSEDEARCIVRKPTLNLTDYKKLDDVDRISLDMCITATPGLPALSIEAEE